METTTPLGTMLLADGTWELRYERDLRHPPEKVWRALTESEHLEHWFPADLVGERRVGAELRIPFWPVFVERYSIEEPELTGRIEVWEPHEVFEWWWDTERIRFELDRTGAGTRLRLTTWIPTDAEEPAVGTAAGYHVCLDRLEELLDAGASSRIADDGVKELEQRYAAAYPEGAS
jgi:uncharacterized protein YndB with AHSA1/START domain